jgi:hypothetical protein
VSEDVTFGIGWMGLLLIAAVLLAGVGVVLYFALRGSRDRGGD